MNLLIPSRHRLIHSLLPGYFAVRSSPRRGLSTWLFVALVATLLLGANTTVRAAARIDSVNRSTVTDGQGVDFSPYAEDDQAVNNGTSAAGTFSGGVALPITLNDNLSLFQAQQNSTVSLTALNFSGTGSLATSQSTNFDANDAVNHAFLQGSVGNSFSVFFTLANSGKLNLNVTIGATTTHTAASFGGSSCYVQLKKGSTVIWSRFTSGGAVSFNGDIALASGSYQLLVSAGSNMDTRSPLGLQLAESSASFSLSGQITETASGGGKKGR
ncbi:MAG: hypothetical protein H7X97_04775 [Opitutaceae bacterium]|nr:hypothetical protein [Verrucomicrobiales bacterium]